MKSTILLTSLFLICALTSYSQKNKGYFSFAFGGNFGQGSQAFGIHLSGNGELANGFFVGAEIGALKFQDLDGPYLPLQAKFTVAPNIDKQKITPLILLEPGYGVYNHVEKISNVYIRQRGGFTFFGGAGLAFPSTGKGRGFLALGYSNFGFETNDIKSELQMFGIRAGIMLR